MRARERDVGWARAPRSSAAPTGRGVLGLCLLVASLLSARPVVAQPLAGEALPIAEQGALSASPETRAQELFVQAGELMLADDAAGACPLLEESQRLDPALGTQFNLAACYEQTGKLASAHRLFSKVADLANALGHHERASMASARVSALEPRLSKLNIIVSASQRDRVEVERDGSLMASQELGVAVPVDAGLHTVRVSGEGLGAWWAEIRVLADPGEHTVFVPVLTEKTLEPQLHSGIASVPPSDVPRMKTFLAPTHRKVAVVAGSMGVLGVSAGTIFGMRAISKLDESDRLGCIGNLCPTAAGVDARRQAQVSTNVATVSMLAGLAGLATAAALFLLIDDDADDARASSRIEPRVAQSSGELLWRGQF
jgi:hypothetical protein